MNIDYNICFMRYQDRIRNLDVKASGVVKSNKFFPVYNIEGIEYIFKPLSKTKPYNTGLFSYAEVVWSSIINEYFSEVPVYQLAECRGYEEEEAKYYDKGCLVQNILEQGQHLVNLYEYFRDYPDEKLDINEYVNYCMLTYDYTAVFKTVLFQNNQKLAEELAMQVLLSILKADQNYHYENIAFACDENNQILKLASMIDHEFSTMFLFGDDISRNLYYFEAFCKDAFVEGRNYRNIMYICENYPEVAKRFREGVEHFRKDIETLTLEDKGFLWACNSQDYQVARALYKENDGEKAQEIRMHLQTKNMNLELINRIVIYEMQEIAEKLLEVLG